jgi:5-methyltetrahydropteroyltriglutamate--homocysteine methyltransferase
MQTYAYGFPRLGENREFKKVTENYWKKTISEGELKSGLKAIEENMLSSYGNCVDKFPIGEMTMYDNMLDTAIMLGLKSHNTPDEYYELCRGKDALEMTKWFNTNYHYLVSDLSAVSDFTAASNKPKYKMAEFNKGIPYFIGPFTFLKLSKGVAKENFKEMLLKLATAYVNLINEFEEVQIDEPAFVLELSADEIAAIKEAYKKFEGLNVKINLFTYYEAVDFLADLYELPVAAIGLDFVNGKSNLENIKKVGFPKDKTLIAGLVDGRNIWRTDIAKAAATLKELSTIAESVIVSNAAPLYHLPVTIEGEDLDEQLLNKIAFAKERLNELKLIKEVFEGNAEAAAGWNKDAGDYGLNQAVKDKVKNLKEGDFVKSVAYGQRDKMQREILNLPLFPTTTIGSYPQDKELRAKRAAFRKGTLSEADYKEFIKGKIDNLIKFQEDMGLDVFVHGEFERTDMVEFFAQKLDGIATTKKAFIISYGTRGYRPPIIFGDVSRPKPMTIEEVKYAQSLTGKPVKGMLTGPVTIIAWSFNRIDIPVAEVAYQIGLCLQDEVKDYEDAGIKIIQIDEAAYREKAPIKKKDWPAYFDWAAKCFNLSSISKPETQIHTHMCYSEFGEIINYICQMDFDCITIEATRSKGDIIKDFKKVNFDRQIGLGVWDIHSPAVPSPEAMEEVVRGSLEALSKENFWINPDCGLKTRDWPETEASLKNLVIVAKKLREELK